MSVRLQASYLVIGSLVSRDWKVSSFGLKILKALDYRERCPIALVSEKHWESFLLRWRSIIPRNNPALLFSPNRIVNPPPTLVVDQALAVVLRRETLEHVLLMLEQAALDIAGYTDVENTAGNALQDVDVISPGHA
jgi:hypothetical protein